MSWQEGAHHPAPFDNFETDEHTERQPLPSTTFPTGVPSGYVPLRFAPSLEVPVQYPAQQIYPIIRWSSGNTSEATPHTSGYESSEGLRVNSKKRKLDEAQHAMNHTRWRPDGLPTAVQSANMATIEARDSYGLPQGTQHDPFEIESSPEPQSRLAFKRQPSNAELAGHPELVIQESNGSVGKPKFYAVAGGHKPGVYTDWADVEQQIKGFSGAKQQKFATQAEALDFLTHHWRLVDASLARRHESSAAFAHRGTANYEPTQSARSVQPVPLSPPPPYSSYVQIPRPDSRIPPTSDPFPIQLDLSGFPFDSASPPKLSEHEDIVPEPEPNLSSEQQHVVDEILAGHNVFFTGSAGCGKSTILKAFVKKLRAQYKQVRIVAPTNLAALNVNGQTTWNFAGWTPDSMKKPLNKLMQGANGKEIWERFNSTDVLVLDEISMVENLQFERLNCVMKEALGQKYGGGAFGGIQVIVTGDFCQLAPVKPFQHCISCGWELIPDHKWSPKLHRCENRHCNKDVFYNIDKWAFRSDAWQECNFKHINLTEIHRQHDKKFISILQRIRTEGVILPNHARILLNHTSETTDAIKLFSKREDVERINRENIAMLPTVARNYKALDHFSWKAHHKGDKSLEKNTKLADDGSDTLQALKDHRYDIYVQFKEGMRVVLQANLDSSAGLVNGSQGAIIGFEPYDPQKLPRKLEKGNEMGDPSTASVRGAHAKYFEHQIKFYAEENKQQPWPIVQFDNGDTRTIYADCTANEFGNDEPYSLLSRTQIPLMAGYAITVHKSQGMTLDRVIVDLSRAFETSQVYVALSRARSLQGLKVVGLPQRNLGGANLQVKEFFEKYLSKK